MLQRLVDVAVETVPFCLVQVSSLHFAVGTTSYLSTGYVCMMVAER